MILVLFGWICFPPFHNPLKKMAAAVAQPRMNPILRASLTSASLMAIGDVVCQKVQGNSITARVDWARVCRFGLVGAMVHGPFLSWLARL